MSEQGSLLGFLSDPRLAPYATGDIPVWLWSADATRILWGNPAAAAIFNAASSTALTGHTIDPKGSAALQIARLAGTLPHGAAPRLERLRGFGGRMGGALMCTCSRISLADRTPAILVVATEKAGPRLPLKEQAQRLLAGCDAPVALFSSDGSLLHATPAAPGKAWPRRQASPRSAPRRSPPRRWPPAAPRATMPPAGFRIERLGAEGSTVLLATFVSPAAAVAAAEPPAAQGFAAASRQPSAPPSRPAAPPTTSRPRRPGQPSRGNRLCKRRPSAASRFASSGRWTTTAASRSTPTNSRR